MSATMEGAGVVPEELDLLRRIAAHHGPVQRLALLAAAVSVDAGQSPEAVYAGYRGIVAPAAANG